ncbi:MAG TPA: acyl carrier protein [Micromonosporaceae bacterium]
MAEENVERTAVVLHTVRQVLGRPELGLDDDVFDNGATSLSFVRILAMIHQETGVAVSAPALNGEATPRRIAALVESALLQSA